MPSLIEIKAHKAQCEVEHIQLQQEEEANLHEQEQIMQEMEECLEWEAEARLEEIRREAAEIIQGRKKLRRSVVRTKVL